MKNLSTNIIVLLNSLDLLHFDACVEDWLNPEKEQLLASIHAAQIVTELKKTVSAFKEAGNFDLAHELDDRIKNSMDTADDRFEIFKEKVLSVNPVLARPHQDVDGNIYAIVQDQEKKFYLGVKKDSSYSLIYGYYSLDLLELLLELSNKYIKEHHLLPVVDYTPPVRSITMVPEFTVCLTVKNRAYERHYLSFSSDLEAAISCAHAAHKANNVHSVSVLDVSAPNFHACVLYIDEHGKIHDYRDGHYEVTIGNKIYHLLNSHDSLQLLAHNVDEDNTITGKVVQLHDDGKRVTLAKVGKNLRERMVDGIAAALANHYNMLGHPKNDGYRTEAIISHICNAAERLGFDDIAKIYTHMIDSRRYNFHRHFFTVGDYLKLRNKK